VTTGLAREELGRASPGRPSVVTIGKFDGVHRGHQHLVGELLTYARAHGLASVVITLYPHPVTVLRPGTPITYLCSLERRVALLKALGVDGVGVLSFTSELAQLAYPDFAALLVEQLDLRALLVGPDFALGRNREGNVEALRTLGETRGFQVQVVSLLNESEAKVGSEAIRQALSHGDMELAGRLLGRPFALRGPVVRGAARGQRIGFATANMAVAPDAAIPGLGVYVTKAFMDEAVYPSVTNIGHRPTFGESRPTIETHLLDFEGDCYDHELRIELLHRLRAERRFAGADELVSQIKRDVAAARAYFADMGDHPGGD
jgi:riboflavin kinase/FMN adenylyltransferase